MPPSVFLCFFLGPDKEERTVLEGRGLFSTLEQVQFIKLIGTAGDTAACLMGLRSRGADVDNVA